MQVTIDLHHDRRQKQIKKRQGLWTRGEGARRKSDDGPRLQPCEEQSCPARPAGHESTAWEEVEEEEKGHLAEKIQEIDQRIPAERERCQTFLEYVRNACPTKHHEHKGTEEGHRLIRPTPEEECTKYDTEQNREALHCNGKAGIDTDRTSRRMQSLHVSGGQLAIEELLRHNAKCPQDDNCQPEHRHLPPIHAHGQ